MDAYTLAQIWVSAVLVIFIYSFLHSENTLYRIVEYILIGAGAGHMIMMGIQVVYTKTIVPVSKGNLIYLPPIILGILMFATFSRKHYWISRYTVALIVGTGTGLALRATPKAQILSQIEPSIAVIGRDAFATFNNVVLLVAAFTAVTYFIFTREIKGPASHVTRVGKYFMLAAFGASFGGTVMTRLAALISQAQFLLQSDTIMATVLASALVLAMYVYMFAKQRST